MAKDNVKSVCIGSCGDMFLNIPVTQYAVTSIDEKTSNYISIDL